MGNIAQWADAAEVAVILGLSRSQVNRQAASRELPVAAKASGLRGAYFFDRAAIEDIKAQRDAHRDLPQQTATPAATEGAVDHSPAPGESDGDGASSTPHAARPVTATETAPR